MTQPLTAGRPAPGADDAQAVDGLIKKARSAMAVFANADQARVDEAGIPLLAWVRERLRLTAIRELESAGRSVAFVRQVPLRSANNG